MRIAPLELWPELPELLFFGVGSVALSGVGIYLEEIALEIVRSGQLTLGVWVAFMGVMAFYFGPYLMGYTEFRPRLARLRDARRT